MGTLQLIRPLLFLLKGLISRKAAKAQSMELSNTLAFLRLSAFA